MLRQPDYPCPACGGFARFKTTDNQSACARCGTVVPPLPFDRNKQAGAGGLPHPTPLRVGMSATIDGKAFYAVGRIAYRQTEEGETSMWEEWVLLHPNGEVRYLEYDAGKWTLSEPWTPRDAPPAAALTKNNAEGNTVSVDGQRATIVDAGVCQVAGVEGEIPWPVAREEAVRYADLQAGGQFFSAEISQNGTVEWFRGRRVDDRAVFTFFGLHDLLKALDKRAVVQKNRRAFGGLLCAAALTAFAGCGAAQGNGRAVGQGSAKVATIPTEGARFGPFSLKAVGRVHRLRVSSDVSQSAVYVQALVEDKTADPLLDVDGDFWDESGYDDEGSWHEYRLQARQDFRLVRAGDYYVRLLADPQANSPASASFVLEEKVLYPSYFAVFGGTALTLGGCFLLAGSPGVGGKVWHGRGGGAVKKQ